MILGYGIKYLWKTINVLQFIIFMRHWLIRLPDKALIYLDAIKMLAMMEFLDDPKNWVLESIGLKKPTNHSLCGPESSVETETTNIWDQGGAFFFIGVVSILVIGIALLIFKIEKVLYKDYKVYKFIMQTK